MGIDLDSDLRQGLSGRLDSPKLRDGGTSIDHLLLDKVAGEGMGAPQPATYPLKKVVEEVRARRRPPS
ncbi:hypothetical protein CRG98_010277 [Punica granatum]|uniref:Uncharacterized protein n=1 Tax=Punica granatum TaxID=22663 RepID=A0A2I0KM58_PUNGR|nr:hypothetical protein CRG98_010277 [Punica granatum]